MSNNFRDELQIPTKKEKRKINDQPTKKMQMKIYVSIAVLFAVIMFVSYRYTLINAKNIELQALKKEYKKVVSEVNLANIDVESKYNLTSVEEYAKQKLGMQKPDIKQIVYVDTRIDNYVENKKHSFWDNILNKILNLQKKIISNGQMQK